MNENHYKAHLWSIEELRRVMTQNPSHCAGWNDDTRYSVEEYSFRQFREFFQPLSHQNETVANAVIQYAKALHLSVRSVRHNMAKRQEYRPLRDEMEDTQETARAVFNQVATRSCPSTRVYCTAGGSSVERKYGSYELHVGPMWKRRVYAHGLQSVEWGGKNAMILKAIPKSSAFLAREGITVWDAHAFLPVRSPEHSEGFIFRTQAGEDHITLFHTDFMRGAALIRKRVRDEVLAVMGISEKVQSNK